MNQSPVVAPVEAWVKCSKFLMSKKKVLRIKIRKVVNNKWPKVITSLPKHIWERTIRVDITIKVNCISKQCFLKKDLYVFVRSPKVNRNWLSDEMKNYKTSLATRIHRTSGSKLVSFDKIIEFVNNGKKYSDIVIICVSYFHNILIWGFSNSNCF
jgi:hypothetical protein